MVNFQYKKATGVGHEADSVEVTTSYSFQQKPRTEVLDSLYLSFLYNPEKLSNRRMRGVVHNTGEEFSVEFHVESTDSAHRMQDEFPKERAESVDTIRIKVRKYLQEKHENAESAIEASVLTLQRIEESIPFVTNDSLISITYHLDSVSGETDYRQESVQEICLVWFDDKLRIREVSRSELTSVLETLSRYRREPDQ